MNAVWTVGRVLLMSIIIVAVAQLSERFPKAGALILSLPIVSVLAILLSWQQHHQLQPLSVLAKETLILVPLGLPFFVPLAFALRLGIGFWSAIASGLVLSSLCITSYLVMTSNR